ncbi:hypothetical protein ElyMa_004722300 [Elysia marginata]|uniref:PiggyBac transposable element-derived protein domain-containing protein n=1 Tax=Elysia marginata TaxID=1093978 RepID=A0AAV4IAM1_9GAST|nr:hypothetical protein ElyMa_004722300 [Elysia marginata]
MPRPRSESSSDSDDFQSENKVETDSNNRLYNADTEIEDLPDIDMESQSDSESEDNDDEWVHQVRHYPRIPAFTGDSMIKSDLIDDPSPVDVYQLFIADELIASWKRERGEPLCQSCNQIKRSATFIEA